MKKRRHLTRNELLAQCNRIARECRMADRSPWSAMSIMCAYVAMKSEGFKAQRILRLTNKVNAMQEQWEKGEITVEQVSKRLMDKAEWTIEHVTYTEADIKSRKGTYQYWLDKAQIAPQNTINEHATRYMLFFFSALMDEYGYGKDRLTRVEEYLNKLLDGYKYNKSTVREWQQELLDEAGLVFELPVDPLTQRAGSIMTN